MRVFVDSNVAMYAAGAAHPNKQPCLDFLAEAYRGRVQAVTSTEVLQEILHRYRRLGHTGVAADVYSLMVQLCVEVLPVTIADTDLCVELLRGVEGSVRDALHVAVMRNSGLGMIASYDAGFDEFGVDRWTFG